MYLSVQFHVEYVFNKLVLLDVQQRGHLVYATRKHNERCDVAILDIYVVDPELIKQVQYAVHKGIDLRGF